MMWPTHAQGTMPECVHCNLRLQEQVSEVQAPCSLIVEAEGLITVLPCIYISRITRTPWPQAPWPNVTRVHDLQKPAVVLMLYIYI